MNKTSPDNRIIPGKHYSFRVSNAEQAVERIRTQMGPKAKVISVKQTNGKGFGRLLNSPQLEIVAVVPTQQPENEQTAQEPKHHPDTAPERNAPPTDNSNDPRIHNANAAQAYSNPQTAATGAAEHEPSPDVLIRTLAEANSLRKCMSKSGFPDALITRLEAAPIWNDLQKLDTKQAMMEIGYWLKKQARNINRTPVGTRLAFAGLPGSGKTTALCKYLTGQVFLSHEKPDVIEIKEGHPSNNDALGLFCNILGVNYHECYEAEDPVTDISNCLYDLPGIALNDTEGWTRQAAQLKEWGVDNPVFVLNAAYDTDVLKKQIECAHLVGAKHLIFTHLDETQSCLKLWPIIINCNIPVLFLSLGQELTDETTHHVIDYMLKESLPAYFVS